MGGLTGSYPTPRLTIACNRRVAPSPLSLAVTPSPSARLSTHLCAAPSSSVLPSHVKLPMAARNRAPIRSTCPAHTFGPRVHATVLQVCRPAAMRCGERHLRRQWRPYHEGSSTPPPHSRCHLPCHACAYVCTRRLTPPPEGHRMLQFDDRLVRSLGRRLEGLPEGGRRDLRGPRRAVRWVWRIFHEGESLLRGGGQVRCGQPVLLQVR